MVLSQKTATIVQSVCVCGLFEGEGSKGENHKFVLGEPSILRHAHGDSLALFHCVQKSGKKDWKEPGT